MTDLTFKKGLDLPIAGAPSQTVQDTDFPASVALIGADTVDLKPKMLVAEGDEVRRGQPLWCHKDSPDVMFTAPATGKVRAINRGARRVLQSVVIDVSDAADTGLDFSKAGDLRAKLAASGLWTSFRTRPYSKVPAFDAQPAAIFVTAMDTEPLCAEASVIINDRAAEFEDGLTAIATLTEGATYLCHKPEDQIPGMGAPGITAQSFAGPHPAGLAGTHIHFLQPPQAGEEVWTIGYQDVIAIGALLRTGHLDPSRIVALSGPMAKNPRLLRTVLGAPLVDLTDGEIEGEAPCRIISGSVLTGRAADGPFAYLGRYARQVTLIEEDHKQLVLGWIAPQTNRYSTQPVLASSFLGRKLYNMTSNLNGGRRAMVPTGTFERLMPQDYLPTQLLRALLVMDTDTAQALGAMELDEEDLALCTFACPAKYEYGEALRKSLTKIEKEG